MREVISVLKCIAEEWCNIGTIPEIDWNRMRMMEFQEVLQFRNSLLTQQKNKGCLLCNDFEDHVRSLIPLQVHRIFNDAILVFYHTYRKRSACKDNHA